MRTRPSGGVLRSRALIGVTALACLGMLSGCYFPGTQAGSTRSAGPSVPTTVTPQPSTAAAAWVTIAGVDVDGENVTVAGFVSGVTESGGTCDFALTSMTTGVVVKVSSVGVQNVQDTSCGSQQIPIARFTRGGWKAVLSYSSSTTKATSTALVLQVP